MTVKGQDDEREWTLSPLGRQTVVLRRDSLGKWVTGAAIDESTIVVPKSRLDAALAGSEARERELERMVNENAAVIEEVEAREAVLVEALTRMAEMAEGECRRNPEATIRAFLVAHEARRALIGVVEAEPAPNAVAGHDSHWATVLINAESFEPREASRAESEMLSEVGIAAERMWIQPGADRRRGERRTGTHWPYGQATDLPERRIGLDRRRAEPDRSER